MTKLVYDLTQRFEIVDGVPTLISSRVQVIEGGSDLFSVAQQWLIKNTKLISYGKQQYVGYKPSKAKRYDLVLASRVTSLQISFPIEKIQLEKIQHLKDKFDLEISPDPVFPYLHRIYFECSQSLVEFLEILFPS
ncbi:hypothetical protein QUB05_04710 [Microcoleus sp. F10-C6]|uniref:hypothetical protein n=1 Tax=unclassified Microcoleus TaxID=2642155 RepID=UPI002FD5E29A